MALIVRGLQCTSAIRGLHHMHRTDRRGRHMKLKQTARAALALVAAAHGVHAIANDSPESTSGTCAVTNPKGGVYGNDSLAAVLPVNGTFVFKPGGPGFVDADGALGIKVGWGARKRGTLLIKGRRLDGEAAPARAYIPHSYDNYVGGMSMYLVFPTTGCWEITGTLAGASLTFVVDVQKIGAGPVSRMNGPPPRSRVSS